MKGLPIKSKPVSVSLESEAASEMDDVRQPLRRWPQPPSGSSASWPLATRFQCDWVGTESAVCLLLGIKAAVRISHQAVIGMGKLNGADDFMGFAKVRHSFGMVASSGARLRREAQLQPIWARCQWGVAVLDVGRVWTRATHKTPEAEFAELHRHGIEIHPIQALIDHLPLELGNSFKSHSRSSVAKMRSAAPIVLPAPQVGSQIKLDNGVNMVLWSWICIGNGGQLSVKGLTQQMMYQRRWGVIGPAFASRS